MTARMLQEELHGVKPVSSYAMLRASKSTKSTGGKPKKMFVIGWILIGMGLLAVENTGRTHKHPSQ